MEIRATLTAKPTRMDDNLVDWMTKKQFGVIHTSLDFGTAIAVESETIKNF